ncbi:uncharacterized protein [Apostichopus japonicus]|uniref:uncharacterized protein isoform X4 n=1 Tax=Stichopus japonicus TaxID=307972 RepID=UPI003AB44E22
MAFSVRQMSFAQLCVIAACCLEKFFLDSVSKVFSVFVEPLVDRSHLSYWTIGMILTWQLQTRNIAIPLASLLLQYKSGRLYVMMAGFMVGLGYIGMSFCLTSSVWLMLLMTSISAVSGFCCGLTSTHIVCECNRIVCKQHFKSGISWTIFCRTISVATGGIVLGYIRDVSGEFTYAFGFLLILCVMCGFMATFLCLPKLKRTTDCG